MWKVAIHGLALILLGSGCNTQTQWTYPHRPNHLFSSARTYDLTIAVLPFEEQRELKNSQAGLYVAMIPLVPYGRITLNRPEASLSQGIAYDFRMPDDLGRAAEESLRRSGLVERTFFTYGSDLDEAQYVLRGRTNSTTYHQTVTFYGLSFPGDLLWLLGLPTGTNDITLEVDLRLEDSGNETRWSYDFSETLKKTQFYYVLQNTNVLKDMPTLMEDGMNRALADLALNLPELERLARQ